MASQISIFVENRPGRISKIAKILGDDGINIRAITIADRGEYGLINLIVDDPDRAEKLLSTEGLSVSRKYVIAIVIRDKPGDLARMADHLNQHDINLNNAYGFILESRKKSLVILEVDNVEKAEAVIRKGGFHTLSREELHNL